MNIFIKNKKILALALCLSITAGQANAISFSSVGNTIGRATTNFCKSAIKDFKAPTWQNSKWMILTSSAIAALYVMQYKIDEMLKKPKDESCSKKDAITYTARDVSILWALSPIAFNLKYLYKPWTAIIYLAVAFQSFLFITSKIKQSQDKKAKEKLESNKKLIELVEKNIEKDGTVTVETLISQGADANKEVSSNGKGQEVICTVHYSQKDNLVHNIEHKSNFRLLAKALLAEKQNSILIEALIKSGKANLRYQDLLLLLILEKSNNKKVDFETVINTKVTEFVCIMNSRGPARLNSLTVKDVLAFEGLETKEEKAKFITDKEQAENEAIKESRQEMLKKSFKSPSQLKLK